MSSLSTQSYKGSRDYFIGAARYLSGEIGSGIGG